MVVPQLSSVTLCAVTSVNVQATIDAMRASRRQANFAQCLLFTDVELILANDEIQVIPIPRLNSADAYSEFILHSLVEYIRTEHCLIVQWDGFVIEGSAWREEFLIYDYIGSPWPHFKDDYSVGNGGFSLRSRRLLNACRDPRFVATHPEDVAICRTNRPFLEREHGIRFAGRHTADQFSFERTLPPGMTFGFHGVFNIIAAVGADRFWDIYESLDDRTTAFADHWALLRQIGVGPHAARRRLQLLRDRVIDKFGQN